MADRPQASWAVLAFGATVVLVLAGCSATPVAKPSHPVHTATPPALAGHLVWGLEQDDSVTLYTSNSDGSNPKPLGAAQHGEQPHFSPDGSKIAIVTSTASGGVVGSVAKPNGSGQRVFKLPSGAPNLACAIWSPDASRLACEGFDDNNPRLDGAYTVSSTDGTDPQRLTQGKDVPCAYSPDGAQLLFIRRDGPDDEHSSLMTVAVGGAHETKVVTPSRVGLSCDWSPDGSTILSELDGSLLFIDAATGVTTPLTIDVRSGRASYSPDGTHIVFSRGTGDHQSDIWTAKIDGTDLVRITSTENNDEEFGDWGP